VRIAPYQEDAAEELYEHAPCGYLTTEPDGLIVRVNETLLTMLRRQRDDLLAGVRFQDLMTVGGKIYNETHLAPLLRMQGFVHEVALELVRSDRSKIPVLVNIDQKRDAAGAPLRNRITVFDATERRKYERELLEARRKAEATALELQRLNATLEERIAHEVAERMQAEEALRQSQKLEALGQLTGGVAHDFNNLLQALAGCLQMIERKAPDSRIKPLLEAGRQAVDRGAKLTRQLLIFARRQTLRPEPVDVTDRLLGMVGLMTHALRADIKLDIGLEPGLWPVEVDPTQFEVALLNLAVNARDAMPQGGRLVIGARNTPLAAASDPEGLDGDFVAISVTDTGVGMTPEVRERVFEPFFTTKGVGKGTGLGLSQVYGFSRQSNGAARIESTPGRGTTVTILLPRSHRHPDALARISVPDILGDSDILLVEDDPIVASFTAATLENFGYRVTCAATADEALTVLATSQRFDLLFTDLVMPGTRNGIELAREAQQLRPGLPVILTTGYGEGLSSADGYRVLEKPYRLEDLVTALGEQLPGDRTGAQEVPPEAGDTGTAGPSSG
jgi:signal transduction histidine kinase/ActR/RegA family two-component response regulator